MKACVMDGDIVYMNKRIRHHLYMENGIAFLDQSVDAFMDNPRLFVGDYLVGKYSDVFFDHSRYVPLALAVLFYRERSSFTMRHDLAYNQIYAKAYESAVPVIKNRLIAHQLDMDYAKSVFAAVVHKLADAHDFESVPLPNIARILAGYKTRRDLCGLIQERDLIATSWRDNDKGPVRFYEINEKDDPDFFLCGDEVDLKTDESEIFHADDLRVDRYMHALGFLPKGLGVGSRMPLEILLRAGESVGLCVVDWDDMLSENNPLDVAEAIPSGDEELGIFMPAVDKKPSRSVDSPLLHDFTDSDNESFAGLISPIRRFGGKIRMTRNILDYLPRAHRGSTYVEPFAGSAAVLFARPSIGVEVINDMDGEVIHFFRTLRDHADELQYLLQSTPYSRALHDEYSGIDPRTLSSVERAVRFFYLSRTSFMADLENPSFGFAKKLDNRADSMRHAVDDLLTFRDRLRRVIIEHDDYAAILTRYDDPDTVFYCDPPYLDSTRKSGGYVNDMESAEEHAILLDRLVELQGYVALSGYPSELYAKRLETTGWTYVDFPVNCRSGRTRGVESTDTARVERLWLNPKLSLYRADNRIQATTLNLFGQESLSCVPC